MELSGQWKITETRPAWADLAGSMDFKRVAIEANALESWDTSLLLTLMEARASCQARGVIFEDTGLPPKVRQLLAQFATAATDRPAHDGEQSFLEMVGSAVLGLWRKTGEFFSFVGECALSAGVVLVKPARFRWRDFFEQVQQCGPMALPIIGLINFLVGVTLAYICAIIVRQFGGDIWVADFVGLSMVREMAPMMTAVVLAGRTGAAFAAEIGNMKANEEIDALTTFGFAPVNFLVLPRVFALGLMMPLLTLYANALGIIGGMVVASTVLDIPAAGYWVELLTAVNLAAVCVGLIKAFTFGLIAGFSGCLRGLQAGRSASGVGRAATSAVVTSILLIVVADSIYAVIFDILGL